MQTMLCDWKHTRVPRSVLVGFGLIALASGAAFASPPPIRTGDDNRVPSCVTPQRLMSYLQGRNPKLHPRYADIANRYRQHGEAWRVRWDYAFFQMALETNFLTYRRADGRSGDVIPSQNNFAGLGTTGGGIPGDSFPSVDLGVLGQIQHLVAYSGEILADPVAPRTRLKQNEIVHASQRLGRVVNFSDLARRWAVDKNYGRSIERLANEYRAAYCTGEVAAGTDDRLPWATAAATTVSPDMAPKPMAARRGVIQPSGPAAPNRCTVSAASYGGSVTLLIESQKANTRELTALTVQTGFEDSMAENFISAYAPGGATIGTYSNRAAALAKARELCPQT